MCGIAGYVGSRELDRTALEDCLSAMRSRGPDGSGTAHFDDGRGRHVYLLATRLTIIDLHERSNQPFRSGTKTMIYNGELYNYVELRAELADAGYEFRTASDTEVVLAALDRLGSRALERFEGMWALAVHDDTDGSLTLSRDRFGEKPLYLYSDGSGFYFGSEVKCIAALLGRRLPVNGDHIRRYLLNGYRALYKSKETFFEGISELAPGTVLSLDAGGLSQEHRYWAPSFRQAEHMSYDEAVAGVRERLFRSVDLRLRADVPLAFCMSGGVDSNALIAVARNVCGYDVHGFTVTNVDARYDERESVAQSVTALGIRHNQAALATAGFLDGMRRLVRYHDAPVYTISYYAHWRLMELIAGAGYRVAVSGTGADELFTGYYDHHLAYLYEVRAEPALHAAARESWEEHVLPLVRNPHLRDPELFISDPGFRDHLYQDGDDLSGYLANGWHEPFHESLFTESLLRNRMLNELFYEVVPVILHEDDLNAMSFSIENRSPYLDRELFEFSYSIPTRHLVRDGFAKAILREAVRGVAPDHVVASRRKVGFNAPIFGFLDRRDAETRRALLAESPIFDYVRRDRIAKLLDEPDLPNSRSKFLFSFVSAKMFLEEFGG